MHRKILARESRLAVLDVLVENWREEVVPEGQGVSGAVPGVVPGAGWQNRLGVLDHYKVPYITQARWGPADTARHVIG